MTGRENTAAIPDIRTSVRLGRAGMIVFHHLALGDEKLPCSNHPSSQSATQSWSQAVVLFLVDVVTLSQNKIKPLWTRQT